MSVERAKVGRPTQWPWPLRAVLLGLLLLLGLSVPACGRDWRTDLWYQQGRASRERPLPEPEGAVALGSVVRVEDRDDADDLHGPPSDQASVDRGKVLFADRCIGCHGREGHGGGPVSKKGFPPAPDLTYASVRARSDGYLFATILLGGRAMPRVGEGLDDRDRWDLVHFMRALQAATPVAAPPPPPPAAPEAH